MATTENDIEMISRSGTLRAVESDHVALRIAEAGDCADAGDRSQGKHRLRSRFERAVEHHLGVVHLDIDRHDRRSTVGQPPDPSADPLVGSGGWA
jgi:hypothetical protein